MSHTPGPWYLSSDPEARGVIYATKGFEWEEICVMSGWNYRDNARLIAAAPEMLKYLEKIMYDMLGFEVWEPTALDLSELSDLIKKARGEA